MIKIITNDRVVGTALFICALILLLDQAGSSSSPAWAWLTLAFLLLAGKKSPAVYRYAFLGIAIGLAAGSFLGQASNWGQCVLFLFFSMLFLVKFFIEKKMRS